MFDVATEEMIEDLSVVPMSIDLWFGNSSLWVENSLLPSSRLDKR